MGDYRKLEVWKLSSSLADRVQPMVDILPRRVQADLGDQLARAAESIPLNISEGCGLNSDAQLTKHVRIALGSANELEDGLERLQPARASAPEHHDLMTDASILRRKLGALLKRLLE